MGKESSPLDVFFLEFEKTALGPDEVLTEIHIPPQASRSGGAYVKFHDRHMVDITTTGAGAFMTLDPDGQTIEAVKIALTTSAPVPLRVREAEAALRSQVLTEEVLKEAIDLVSKEATPRTSWRSTKEFRLELIRALVKRALTKAWKKAKGTTPPVVSPPWLFHSLHPQIGGTY